MVEQTTDPLVITERYRIAGSDDPAQWGDVLQDVRRTVKEAGFTYDQGSGVMEHRYSFTDADERTCTVRVVHTDESYLDIIVEDGYSGPDPDLDVDLPYETTIIGRPDEQLGPDLLAGADGEKQTTDDERGGDSTRQGT